MKKLLLSICLLLLPVLASAYTNPGSPQGFINDYAGMISESAKQALEQTLVDFEKETSNEITVVTINSLEGDIIEDFAVELFADWGIGKKDKDNGILLLIAKEDREMRIEVGYGLEGALTDGQAYWIIQNDLRPNFQERDYDTGIVAAVESIMTATRGEYIPEASSEEGEGGTPWDFIVYIAFFVFIWLASILGRSKRWWPGGVIGGVAGAIIGLVKYSLLIGGLSFLGLGIFGLLFDYFVSKSYHHHKSKGSVMPWYLGGRGKGGKGGFGGFGGFGGGMSGGGGSSGSW